MSAANAHQAKRVMNVDCLSSVCLNLLDSYPRIKALHFHQKYVASLQGNSANIESFFHIRRGIESQCSCSQSYAMVTKRIFAAGQALPCPLGTKLLRPERMDRISASLAEIQTLPCWRQSMELYYNIAAAKACNGLFMSGAYPLTVSHAGAIPEVFRDTYSHTESRTPS